MGMKAQTLFSIGLAAANTQTVDPIRPQLQAILDHYLKGKKRDAGAFSMYCAGLSKAIREAPEITLLRAQLLLGMYVEAAMKSKRPASRPRKNNGWMFVHLWMEIADEHGGRDTVLIADTPAKQIAAACARKGWGEFTARQVSDALRKIERPPAWQ